MRKFKRSLPIAIALSGILVFDCNKLVEETDRALAYPLAADIALSEYIPADMLDGHSAKAPEPDPLEKYAGKYGMTASEMEVFIAGLDYGDHILNYSKSFGVDPMQVAAVMEVESSRNPRATSSKNARGLMQVRGIAERQARQYGGSRIPDGNAYDPEVNIALGTAYWGWLKNRWLPYADSIGKRLPETEHGRNYLDSDDETVLGAYFAGPANVERRGATKGTKTYVKKVADELSQLIEAGMSSRAALVILLAAMAASNPEVAVGMAKKAAALKFAY